MMSTGRRESDRYIQIDRGNFNVLVLDLLRSGRIKPKEATFCLLDQRTFECQWATLRALAEYKTAGYKIELFYFLPNSWLDRALAAQKNTKVVEQWWGREDWPKLRNMHSYDRVAAFVDRFKKELGYWSAKPWPIYERQDGGTVMYHMIHATDYPDAPKLMERAYKKAVMPKETGEQLLLWAQSAGLLDLTNAHVTS